MFGIYLDNSASTRPYPEVCALTAKVQDSLYANASAMHKQGVAANLVIQEARRQVAVQFRGLENEIIFTAGGTEANNLALIGTALRHKPRGRHLVTTKIEHPSVLNCFRFLEESGFRVTYLPVDHNGLVNVDQVGKAVRNETILVSIMHVNNELGTIEPLTEIGSMIKKLNPRTIFHVDAVQSFGRLTLEVDLWRADMVSCSAHKIHGPKGAGCLWIREGISLKPILYGGGQEQELRSGTENTAAIVGFGLAAKLTGIDREQKAYRVQAFKESFVRALESSDINFYVNGPDLHEGAPHIVNLSFPGLAAEILMHELVKRGVYVSSGSACHSSHPEPSHVLQAINLVPERLHGSLRFSFSILNNEEEAVRAAALTVDAIKNSGDLTCRL